MYFKFFKRFIESIDLDSREVTIPEGQVLYHGTVESYDARNIRSGAYDNVFWTAEKPIIARMYIPRRTSSASMSVKHILQDPAIRKSIGLTDKIISLAWEKSREGYQKLLYWEKLHKQFAVKAKELENDDFDSLTDEFFDQWRTAESNYKKAQQEWKDAEHYLKLFIVQNMRAFGYEPKDKRLDYYSKVLTDREGNLLPADTSSVGRVLKVICKRDFKFYNYAHEREGDLTNVDYHNTNFFKKLEEIGYDGVIINDFAQSDHLGNVNHISIGFFKNSIKDLAVKTIRNQTHPTKEEWNNR